jgi:carbonic anhydrase
MCGTGRNQSPVNIGGLRFKTVREAPAASYATGSKGNLLSTTAHTIQIDFEGPATRCWSSIMPTFTLQQIALPRTPSENQIAVTLVFPMEGAFSLIDDPQANLLVVAGDLFEGRRGAQRAWTWVWAAMPPESGPSAPPAECRHADGVPAEIRRSDYRF